MIIRHYDWDTLRNSVSYLTFPEIILILLGFTQNHRAGAHPTNDISITFEIQPKFAVLWFVIYSADQKTILHTSWQCNCRGVRKISLWSVEQNVN